MNNDSDLLQKFLELSLESVKKTGDFVVQQAPDFIHEILAYNMIKNVALFFIFLCAVAYLSRVVFCILKRQSATDGAIVAAIVLIGFDIIFIILAMINAFSGIKIVVAPKLYLLEYAADLIK